MDWIVHCARMNGLAVQATSVPGVAQRTGSTSYYIEMCEKPAGGPAPVFALTPMPGRVDYVAASELVEAARLMERGLVSPTRTILVASTSRMFTTDEKMQMGDGRFESERVLAAGRELAKKFVTLDLDAIARENGTMVSATLFGALAGVGAFPWDRATCEAAIGTGRAAAASRAGFNAAFEEVTKRLAAPASNSLPLAGRAGVGVANTGQASPSPTPSPSPQGGRGAPIHVFARGRPRDRRARLCPLPRLSGSAYADLFAQRVLSLAKAGGPESPERAHALAEAARRLACG